MQQHGVRSDQVTQVRGYADQLLRVSTNPSDPSNRRISILVRNSDEAIPALSGTRVVNGAAPPVPQGEKAGEKSENTAENQAAPKGAQPGAAEAAQSKTAPAPAAKPSAGTPAAKPGLMDRIKGMMPGAKK